MNADFTYTVEFYSFLKLVLDLYSRNITGTHSQRSLSINYTNPSLPIKTIPCGSSGPSQPEALTGHSKLNFFCMGKGDPQFLERSLCFLNRRKLRDDDVSNES